MGLRKPMTGICIAHVINPVKVPKDRDLYFQQPITFEALLEAKKSWVDIIAVYYPEDESVIPYWVNNKVELIDEIGNYQKFQTKRKLPLFREMMDKLYEASRGYDYLIQTNADIGVQPYFYDLIKKLINDGCDSFCINKRIIPEALNKIEDLPIIWATIGNQHAGHDCFVFRRELYPKFDMGKICMGTPWSETVLITNLVKYAKNFQVFKNAHATFHIGDRRTWLPEEFNDYRINNTNEFARVLRKFSKEDKTILNHETIQYLLGKLKQEVHGYKNEVYSDDCWYLIKT